MVLFHIILFAVAILSQFLFEIAIWFQYPTALSWLWAFGIAACVSVLGCVLLFLAMLPQYRAGVFFSVGSKNLTPRYQRLYRTAFWFIVPSVSLLLTLLLAVQQFQ